jgi:predicted nucleotidyltransferase
MYGGNVKREKRMEMLNILKEFLPSIKRAEGVEFIGLIGSITRDSPEPKDIDIVVCVTTPSDLSELGTVFRKIAGRMMQIGKGADMFVYDSESGNYIGRICGHRECRAGIRLCDADNCGKRPYLKDDLSILCLPPFVGEKVPVELYPRVRYNPPEAPSDVNEVLLTDHSVEGE